MYRKPCLPLRPVQPNPGVVGLLFAFVYTVFISSILLLILTLLCGPQLAPLFVALLLMYPLAVRPEFSRFIVTQETFFFRPHERGPFIETAAIFPLYKKEAFVSVTTTPPVPPPKAHLA